MKAEDLRPGAIIEWPHAPDFKIFSRLIVDQIEDGYAWVHFEKTGTKDRLAVPTILRRARIALATGREVEWLKRLVRCYVDPFNVASIDHEIVLALGTDDEDRYRAALEK